MPIRIEHQPSPYAVGLAGWQAGRGAAKQRQQKYVLDLWKQDRQNRYMEDRQDRQNRYMEDRQDQRQQWMNDRDVQHGVQRGWQAIVAGLPPKPENALPAQRKRLQELYQDMTKLSSGAFGMGDNVTGPLGTMLDEINSIHSAIPKMDAGEQASKNWGYLNPETGARAKMGEQPGEGMVLWDYSKGAPLKDDRAEKAAAAAEKAAAAQRQQAADAQEQTEYKAAVAANENWIKRRAAIADTMRERNNKDETKGVKGWRSEKRIMKDATKQMIAESWGEMPPIPLLRPGEKPHMNSPALGSAIEPLTPADEAAIGIAPPASASAPPTINQSPVASPVQAATSQSGVTSVPATAPAVRTLNMDATGQPTIGQAAPATAPATTGGRTPQVPALTLVEPPEEQTPGMVFQIPSTGTHPYTTAVRNADGKYTLAAWSKPKDGQDPQMRNTGWSIPTLPKGSKYISGGPPAQIGKDGYYSFGAPSPTTPASGVQVGGPDDLTTGGPRQSIDVNVLENTGQGSGPRTSIDVNRPGFPIDRDYDPRLNPNAGQPTKILQGGAPGGGSVPPQARAFNMDVAPVVGDWAGPGGWGKSLALPPPQLPVPVNQRRPVGEPAMPGAMQQPSGLPEQQQPSGLPEQQRPITEPFPLDVVQSWHDMESAGAIPSIGPQKPTPREPTLVPATNIQDESKQRFSATWGDDYPTQPQPPELPEAYQKKPESFVFDEMPWAFRKRALQAFAAGSTNSQAALAERYPGIREAADRIFNAPPSAESRAAGERENRLQESYYGTRQPQPSSLRQHTEAQYGPRRGTGEGIPGDVARMMGGVEGAGGLAGRTAAIARDESRFPLGIANAPKKQGGYVPSIGPIVTKYNLPPDEAAAERERKMNAGYARAMAKKEERERLAASGQTSGEPPLYLGDGAGTGTPARRTASEVAADKKYREIMGAGRQAELENRKMMRQLAQVRVRTDADFAKLRPGTYFIGPDGKPRRKP